MLTLLDLIWLCLKLCPNSARTETFFGRWPTVPYDCLRFARKKYRGIILSHIIPKSHISHWVLGMIYFLKSSIARMKFYLLRYAEVGIPLRHPSWFNMHPNHPKPVLKEVDCGVLMVFPDVFFSLRGCCFGGMGIVPRPVVDSYIPSVVAIDISFNHLVNKHGNWTCG